MKYNRFLDLLFVISSFGKNKCPRVTQRSLLLSRLSKYIHPSRFYAKTKAYGKRHTAMRSLSKSIVSVKSLISRKPYFSTMSINLKSPVFAGNPIRSKTPKTTDPFSPTSAFQTLKILLSGQTHVQEPSSPKFKVLPFRKGRPLAGSTGDSVKKWHLGWLNFGDFKGVLESSELKLSDDLLVYLGCESKEEKEDDSVVYWAIDVSESISLVEKFGNRQFCFVELRTLMVATDWADYSAMGDLAIAGHVSFLLQTYFDINLYTITHFQLINH